jgi:urocanate hydratase
VCVDGSALSARRAELMLTNDPSTGVMRHVDAGYEPAWAAAQSRGVRIPMPPAPGGAG